LIILLHGFGANGDEQALYFGLAQVADAHGIIFATPNGTTNDQGKRFWNATDACCAPSGSDVDDSQYLANVIQDVESRYSVDPRRVYVLGHSNGGFMAYRMACDHADLVAAAVSFEGAMLNRIGDCTPAQPVSVLEVHGTGDTVISYNGGRASPESPPYPSAAQTVHDWARLDHCSPTPVSLAPRELVRGQPAALVSDYPGCAKGTDAQLWTIPGGGHAPGLNTTFTEQVVEFLLAHPKQ